jgi:hypothetical protein
MARAVAARGIASALVLIMAPSTAVLIPAVRARVRMHFNIVPHSCCLHAILDQTLCHLAPLQDTDYR